MTRRFLNFIFCVMLLGNTNMYAQDITGLWKGELFVDSTKQYLPYEITISEKKGKLTGYAYLSFQQNGREQVVVRKIAVKQKDDQVTFEDDDMIDDNLSFNIPKNIKQTTNVTLTVQDTMMYLIGEWSTNRSRKLLSSFGTIKLQRKNYFKTTALYKKLDSLKLSETLAFTEGPKIANTAVAVQVKKVVPTDIAKIETPVVEKKPLQVTMAAPPPVKPNPVLPVIAVVEKKIEAIKIDTPIVVSKPANEMAISKQQEKPVVAVIKKASLPVTVTTVSKPEVKPTAIVVKPNPPLVKPVVSAPAKQIVTAKASVKPPPPVTKPVAAVVPVPAKVVTPIVVIKPVQNIVIDPASVNAATDVNSRSIATTQSVFYKSDSLVLTLYDNGEVDGDVVSVLMNGKLIFANQALTTKANSKTIYITPDTPDSLMLVMYAENLGSIPPNTGLLVIHDGEDTYDLRFKADLKTNAAIVLRRKPKQ